MVFYKLRHLNGITEEDYLKSFSPNQLINSIMSNDKQTLYELCSSGQSGSLFYYTKDRKFMMKTIPKREFDKFRDVLKDYFEHMKANRQSLISRFYGLHEVKWKGSDAQKNQRYLVIMNNVFIDYDVGLRFDLKGSVHGRTAIIDGQNLNQLTPKQRKTALKDNDFRTHIKEINLDERPFKGRSNGFKRKPFHEIIKADSDFFIRTEIIDYSLLLGEIVNIEFDVLCKEIAE